MSNPLRNAPRPVKTLRAAPTPKWDSMLIAKESQIAGVPQHEEWEHRNKCADRGGQPGDPPLSQR